jgi:hypothetical protein
MQESNQFKIPAVSDIWDKFLYDFSGSRILYRAEWRTLS